MSSSRAGVSFGEEQALRLEEKKADSFSSTSNAFLTSNPLSAAAAAAALDFETGVLARLSKNPNSLFLFPPQHPLRRFCTFMRKNDHFNNFILLCILVNCFFIAVDDSGLSWVDDSDFAREIIFLVIFFIEMVFKVISFGFVFGKEAYLRDGWNCLDFFLVISSFFNFVPGFGNVSMLRVVRVLRALRSVNKIRGMKIIINSLLSSLGDLRAVISLVFFVFFIAALVSVQFWMGSFHNLCAADVEVPDIGKLMLDMQYLNNRSNLNRDNLTVLMPQAGSGRLPTLESGMSAAAINAMGSSKDTSPPIVEFLDYQLDIRDLQTDMLCSPNDPNLANYTPNGRHCSDGYTCRQDFPPPYYGFVHFDHFGSAALILFICMTGENWSQIHYWTGQVGAFYTWIFWTIFMIVMNVIGTNMVLAVIIGRFSREKRAAEEEKTKVHILTAGENDDPNSDKPGLLKSFFLLCFGPFHQWCMKERTLPTNPVSRFCRYLSEHPVVDIGVTLLIICNTLILCVEHYKMSPEKAHTLESFNAFFTFAFAAESILKLIGMWVFFFVRDPMNVFDGVIVFVSVVDYILASVLSEGGNLGGAVIAFRVLRTVRIFKLARKWTSMQRILQQIMGNVVNLACLIGLVILFTFIFAVAGRQLFRVEILVDGKTHHEDIFLHHLEDGIYSPRANFHSLATAMLTTFRVLTGDAWSEILFTGMRYAPIEMTIWCLLWVMFGNFVLVNLFVAVLLEGMENQKMDETPADGTAKVESGGPPPQGEGNKKEKNSNRKSLPKESKKGETAGKESTSSSEQNPTAIVVEAGGPKSTSTAGDSPTANFHTPQVSRTASGVPRLSQLALHSVSNTTEQLDRGDGGDHVSLLNNSSPSQTASSSSLSSSSAPSSRPTNTIRKFFSRLSKKISALSDAFFEKNEDRVVVEAPHPLLIYKEKREAVLLEKTLENLHREQEQEAQKWSFGDRKVTATVEKVTGPRVESLSTPKKVTKDVKDVTMEPRTNSPPPDGREGTEMSFPSATPDWRTSGLYSNAENASLHDSSRNVGLLERGEGGGPGGATPAAPLEGRARLASYRSDEVALRFGSRKGLGRLNTSGRVSKGTLTPSDSSYSFIPRPPSPDDSDPDAISGSSLEDGSGLGSHSKRVSGSFSSTPPSPPKPGSSVDSSFNASSLSPKPSNFRTVQKVGKFGVEWKVVQEGSVEDRRNKRLQGNSLGLFAPTNKIRRFFAFIICSTPFELAMMMVIFLSCILLALDYPSLDPESITHRTIEVMDNIILAIFITEGVLNAFVFGLIRNEDAYLRSGWDCLDFLIICCSILAIPFDVPAVRAIRAIRPLRIMGRLENTKVVLAALIASVKASISVVAVSSIFWIIFGIMGVQLFQGALEQCSDPHVHDLWLQAEASGMNMTGLLDMDFCNGTFTPLSADLEQPIQVYPYVISQQPVEQERVWGNPYPYSFDSFGESLLVLFIVCLQSGWFDIMYSVVDMPEIIGNQPVPNNYLTASLYFVAWIFIGALFSLNIFLAAIINAYDDMSKNLSGSIFLTEAQQQHSNLAHIAATARPKRKPVPPSNPFRRFLYILVNNQYFGYFITTCIVLNVLSVAVDHYGINEDLEHGLEALNTAFQVVFVLEAAMRMIALFPYQYFMDSWNVLDFILVLLGFLNYFVSIRLNYLRVIRLIRITRYVKSLKHLISVLVSVIPKATNVGLVLMVFFYMFSIAGMQLFGLLTLDFGLSDTVNFQTFWPSMSTLFRLYSKDNFSDIMFALMGRSGCDPTDPTMVCGESTAGALFTTGFLVFLVFILANLFIGIILDSFGASAEEKEENLLMDQWHRLSVLWEKLDPDLTYQLPPRKLMALLNVLGPPLWIDPSVASLVVKGKTESVLLALRGMDIPLTKDKQVLFEFVLRGLTARAAGIPLEENSEVSFDQKELTGLTVAHWYVARLLEDAYLKGKRKIGKKEMLAKMEAAEKGRQARLQGAPPEYPVYRGSVASYDPLRGTGFIARQDGELIILNVSNVVNSCRVVEVGDQVEFQIAIVHCLNLTSLVAQNVKIKGKK